MKRNLHLSMIAIFLAIFTVNAQNAKINWGGDFVNNKWSPYPDFYCKTSKEVRAVFYDRKEKTFFVSKYDYKSLTKQDDVPVFGRLLDQQNDMYEDHNLIKYYGVGENLYLFTLEYDKKNDVSTLFCTKIDKSLKASKPVIVDQISAEKKSEAYSFQVFQSTDSSKFVIMKNPQVKKNDMDVYFFKLIDVATLKATANFSYTATTKERNTNFKDIIFTKDGIMFLLLTVVNEDVKKKNRGKSKEEKIERISYKIVTANPKSNYDTQEFNGAIPGKDMEALSLKYNRATNKVYGIGMYSNLKTSGKAEWGLHGLAYLSINEDKVEVEKSFFKDFPDDIVTKIAGARAARKERGISGNFEIKSVITREDGGLFLVMEEDYVRVVTTTTTNPNGGTTTSTTYYYNNNDVLVTNIGAKGTIDWYTYIPKYQETANDNGYRNSIYAHYTNKKLHIVFNGSKKMTEENDVTMRMNLAKNKCAVIDVVVDKEGKYKIHELDNKAGEHQYVILPKYMQKVGDQEAITIGEKAFKSACFKCGCLRKKKSDDRKLGMVKFD